MGGLFGMDTGIGAVKSIVLIVPGVCSTACHRYKRRPRHAGLSLTGVRQGRRPAKPAAKNSRRGILYHRECFHVLFCWLIHGDDILEVRPTRAGMVRDSLIAHAPIVLPCGRPMLD